MHQLLAIMTTVLPRSLGVRLWLVIALSILLSLLDAGLLLIIGPLFDSLVSGGDSLIFGYRVGLFDLAVAAGLILVTKNVFFIGLAWYRNRLAFRIQEYLSSSLLERVIFKGAISGRGVDPGKKLSYVITEPLQTVLNVYLPMISLISEFSLVVFLSVSLFIVDFVRTATLLAILLIVIGSFHWSTRRWLQHSGARRKDADGQRNDIVRSTIDAEADLTAMNWVSEVISLYTKPNHVSSTMTANKAFATDIVKNVVELSVLFSVGLLVLAAGARSFSDVAPLLAVFAVAAYRLMPSLNRLIVCSQSIRFGAASLEVVSSMLARSEWSQGKFAQGCRKLRSDFELDIKAGEFKSPTGSILVKDVHLRLGRGALIALSGPSGIGKSSLLKAIISGHNSIHIRLDGVQIPSGLILSGLSIGMAGQRPFILPASLGRNIFPNFADNAEARKSTLSSEQQCVVDGLADMHAGSIIGKNAILDNLGSPVSASTLSGGQAQRVALMRAFICGSDVLVFDEPTSALDAYTRDRFIELLLKMSSTRAVLIASHDPAVLNIANQVVELRALE